jgi:hypothetical protein
MIEASVSIEDLKSLKSIHNIDAAKVLASTIVDEIACALKEPGQQSTNPALFILYLRD